MLFAKLADHLQKLENTPSRTEMTVILAQVLVESTKEEIAKTVNLILGQLAPSYTSVVFNLAERMMVDVLGQAYGFDKEEVRKLYKQEGDLGTLAQKLSESEKIPSVKNRKLSVADVYDRLLTVAKEEGEKSVERKTGKMAALLSELDPLSARFVARMPVGRLRLGFSDKTILDALSWMEVGDKSKKAKLERAYQVIPDVALLAQKVKEMGIDKATKDVKPIVGIPVLPMLPQRIKSPTEMIAKMGKVFVEPKFDGLRVLIHYRKIGNKEELKAFTRNLNNVADMFSELKEVGKHINATEVILDSEAIGMDPDAKKMADFQTTMQRRRKYEIETKAKEIPLRFQVFDILYKDGEGLMDMPYYARREVLKKTIVDSKLLIVDDAVLTEDPKVIIREHAHKVKAGLEGVVVKKYDTAYVPGRTGWRWVKMKQSEDALGKLADTVDCVVMGCTAGRGKRASFGLGQFLVGVRDGELIKTVTKVGTGLSDDQLQKLFKSLKKLEAKNKPKEYSEVSKILLPDFWVTPSVVVEIAADEITKSPNHSSGLALRFPRLVRFREDKSPAQATTLAEVKKLFDLQKVNSNN